MKLTLNLPALERLLGGDTDIEVQMRQQIVEEFTRKHLKPLINDPLIRKLHTSLEEEIKKEVGTQVWDTTGKLTPHLQKRVDDLITESVKNAITKAASQSFETLIKQYETIAETRINRYEIKLMTEANSRIDKALKSIDEGLNQRLDEAFEKRVTAEVNRRLKVAASI